MAKKTSAKQNEVTVHNSQEPSAVKRKTFTGPTGVHAAKAALRVMCSRQAMADLGQHAKESLEAEICGVLIGSIYSDDVGLWVQVDAIIRGGAAQEQATTVTFTQETWNHIHREKDQHYPKLHIVGWYHSHPGYGVKFSEMDVFVHQNFFSQQGQIALVTDPIGGSEAICFNSDHGIEYISLCWVDGRERKLWVPETEQESSKPSPASTAQLERMEQHIGRLSELVTKLSERVWSVCLFTGMVIILLAATTFAWHIVQEWNKVPNQPSPQHKLTIPIQVGDDEIMMYAQVYGWKVPDELRAQWIEEFEENIAQEVLLREQAELKVKLLLAELEKMHQQSDQGSEQ